ncbi:hypothetical protein [Pseudomonas agarici]|uniref:hypothetical protein n=1 Tax=Pseudomonas agarici TaxID=46677 RepID=UPI0015A387D1|nr:hypothetical protein [Pseudomonas agarici]NWB92321.1 hypothetical protein [Pseudomonas agarici]
MEFVTVAAAFNRWMDDYTKNPEAYEATRILAMRHLNEKLDGLEPSYGASCAAVFFEYLSNVDGAAAGPSPSPASEG